MKPYSIVVPHDVSRRKRASDPRTFGPLPPLAPYSMIPKSGYRFSEKIMLQQ
jgi:hypothetical protein